MQIRVNQNILSVVPYISTSWSHIVSLKSLYHDSGVELLVTLQDGSLITIPGLTSANIEEIFSAHAAYLERCTALSTRDFTAFLSTPSSNWTFVELKGLTSFLQHDTEQSQFPDFPEDVQEKIISLASALPIHNSFSLPREEPHCNCPHCQTVRLMKTGIEFAEKSEGEVLETDLLFRSWILQEISPKEYIVTHPDQPQENYTVSLHSPLSCSCGSNCCDHIKAILNS